MTTIQLILTSWLIGAVIHGSNTINNLKKNERTGRSLCVSGFLDHLETFLGRSLKPKKAGRKPKKKIGMVSPDFNLCRNNDLI